MCHRYRNPSSLGHTMLGLLERAACSKVDVSLYSLGGAPALPCYARAQVVALAASLTIAQLKSGFYRRMTTEVWTWFFFIPGKRVTSNVPSLSSFKWILL